MSFDRGFSLKLLPHLDGCLRTHAEGSVTVRVPCPVCPVVLSLGDTESSQIHPPSPLN